MKSLKCNKPISFLRSYNDLGYWTTPHFYTNDHIPFTIAQTFLTNHVTILMTLKITSHVTL
jgi:hypothetical protein